MNHAPVCLLCDTECLFYSQLAVLMPAISTKSVTRTWLNYAPAAMRHGGLPPDAKAGDQQTLSTVGKNLLCGAIAGAVSRTCTAPLDRLKVIMQAGGGVGGTFSGKFALRGAIRDVYRDGGWRAFWRGNGTNVLKIMPESGVKFMAFDLAKTALCSNKSDPKFIERFASGSVAGLTSQFVIYPMDIVKTRLAISARGQYNGIIDCLVKTVQREGGFAVYKGLGPALVGIVPAVGIDMAIYNHLKDEYRARKIQQSALPGGIPEQTDTERVLVSLACGSGIHHLDSVVFSKHFFGHHCSVLGLWHICKLSSSRCTNTAHGTGNAWEARQIQRSDRLHAASLERGRHRVCARLSLPPAPDHHNIQQQQQQKQNTHES